MRQVELGRWLSYGDQKYLSGACKRVRERELRTYTSTTRDGCWGRGSVYCHQGEEYGQKSGVSRATLGNISSLEAGKRKYASDEKKKVPSKPGNDLGQWESGSTRKLYVVFNNLRAMTAQIIKMPLNILPLTHWDQSWSKQEMKI